MAQDIVLTDLAAAFPALAFDLKYATADNIAGYAIYTEARALLHPVAASALQKSIEIARLAGFTLLILDARRPQQAQRNRLMLNAIMLGGGFVGMPTEWWHFELPEANSYSLPDDRFSCVSHNNSMEIDQ